MLSFLQGRRFFSLVLMVLFGVGGLAAEVDLKTPAEAVQYVEYSQYPAITTFLSRLDHQASSLAVRIVGRTLPTEEFPAADLYLCILTEEGIDRPDLLNREKPTFYIVAAKHGNEQSGKEAALRLIRDLAVGELRPLLRNINVLILPTANPYGNWFDQRGNEQDLDVNRDQVKLESPEAETIHRIFRDWMPEVTMDVHEKGDDYYQVNVGCVSNVNISFKLQEFSRSVLFPEVEKALHEKSYTFHEYLVSQRMGIDSSAGVTYEPRVLGGRETMMRYSTTDLNDGRNSPGIYQTLSFIQEGASRHDLATLKLRSDYQYFGLRFLMESVIRHDQEVLGMVGDLRRELIRKAGSYSADDLIHLRMKYARDPDNPTLALKRLRRSRSPIRGVLKVDKKAGDPVSFSDLEPFSGPADVRIEEFVVENWFPMVESTLSVPRPLGYIIPAGYGDVIEILHRHGIELFLVTEDTPLEAEVYRIKKIVQSEYDFLPPQTIEVEKGAISKVVSRGDIFVPCAQPAAAVIPCLLEPQSQYGFIRYWKFKLVPQEGDLFPFVRVTSSVGLPTVPYKSWGR